MENTIHTFHIPVMGTGFSIDSPIKVARYGISSVISLVDDTLIEEMRKYYCEKFGEVYQAITKSDHDYRAKRITEYLNLVDRIVKKQFEELKASAFEMGTEITKYFELLPETSPLKKLYHAMLKTSDPKQKKEIQDQLRDSVRMGSIDVNIMTKLDRVYYDKDGKSLGQEFSDALAALRGYAQSTLKSAMVFSAGINQRLYSYTAEFKDFYADKTGEFKKKIVLKVSDYRSSIIQGKFFAKKGLWVSEYRIESGLNCGGHAFPSDGYLMGPILKEFRDKKDELIASLHKVYNEALKLKNRFTFPKPHKVKLTAQGGIGTAHEDRFLREHFKVESTGWGTPFLLCPEVTNVEDETFEKLVQAGEDDLYLSQVSPVGVPFNTLKNNSFELEKQRRIQEGHPGSPCPRNHLCFDTEFTDKPICVASRQYQKLKLAQLEKLGLSKEKYEEQKAKILDKDCLCYHLGNGVLMKNGIIENGSRPSSICPGPNLAYYSKIVSLKEMVDHIYGRISILNKGFRSNLFLKELGIYVEHFVKELKKCLPEITDRQLKHFEGYKQKMLEAIEYYKELFPKMIEDTQGYHKRCMEELQKFKQNLENTFFQKQESVQKEEKTSV